MVTLGGGTAPGAPAFFKDDILVYGLRVNRPTALPPACENQWPHRQLCRDGRVAGDRHHPLLREQVAQQLPSTLQEMYTHGRASILSKL